MGNTEKNSTGERVVLVLKDAAGQTIREATPCAASGASANKTTDTGKKSDDKAR